MTELLIENVRVMEIGDRPRKANWWDNFIDSLPLCSDFTATYWYETRDQHLAMWGAVLHYDAGQAKLVFEHEASCTMFLLKFG